MSTQFDGADSSRNAIAIIGMSGRFPGALTLSQFWSNLCQGVESILPLSEPELLAAGVDMATLSQPNYVRAKGVLQDVDLFDAALFGLSPREAAVTDPQHRLFLECAWEALEVAGYNSDYNRGAVGVYAGVSMSTYLLANLLPNPQAIEEAGHFQVLIGNDKDFVTTRASYKLNLTGPSMSVQSACSSSLVAVHLACQSLLQGECDMALAGGASVLVPQRAGYLYRPDGVVSPDGHCRAFDARAEGSVSGSGVGVVVLKRLADARADRDSIDAVILGTAINNDGARKAGFWAPSVGGQAAVVGEAQAVAGIPSRTITYVETHGTGTKLGDPVELAALTDAFRLTTEATQFCAIGSLKTNVGHLEAAAGVAGLIKTALSLKHRQLPPTLHFERGNPAIEFASSPFFVNTSLREWRPDGHPLRAGVSSLGIGGTNAHVIVEEAPPPVPSSEESGWHLLVLSAHTDRALEAVTDNIAGHLEKCGDQSLADITYTCAVGRRCLSWRRAVVCHDRASLTTALKTRDPEDVSTGCADTGGQAVTFLLPGLGDHYVNMSRGLYDALPAFRADVDDCAERLRSHLDVDIREVLFAQDAADDGAPEPARGASEVDFRRLLGRRRVRASAAEQRLMQTRYAQPALFVVEFALARMWMRLGVTPKAMIGYSLGEYVAACLAGVFSLEDALLVIARRAEWIAQLPPGTMVAVSLAERDLLPYLGPGVSIAATNAPAVCVVAGTSEAVEALETKLARDSVTYRRLETLHAFHSAALQPVAAPLRRLLSTITLSAPSIPLVSNLTGRWLTPEEATDPQYWADQMTHAVRFSEGLHEIAAIGGVRLEVGPGHALSTLALQHEELTTRSVGVVASSLRHAYDRQADLAWWLRTVGRLWLTGVEIDWPTLFAPAARARVPLPTYPFERQRYWIDPPRQTAGIQARVSAPGQPEHRPVTHARPALLTTYVAPANDTEHRLAALWSEALGTSNVGTHDNFFELGGHSLLGAQLLLRVREAFGLEIPVRTLFERPTVASLAEAIMEGILSEIEHLEPSPVTEEAT